MKDTRFRIIQVFVSLLLNISSPLYSQVSITIEPPGDRSSVVHWKQKIGSNLPSPERQCEQSRVDSQSRGFLSQSLCIRDELCNFLQKDAVSKFVYKPAREESRNEIESYKTQLTEKARKQSLRSLSDLLEKEQGLHAMIKADVETYREKVKHIYDSPSDSQFDSSSINESIRQYHEEAETGINYDGIPDPIPTTLEQYPFRTPLRSPEGRSLLNSKRYAEFTRTQVPLSDENYVAKMDLVDLAEANIHYADELFSQQSTEEGHDVLVLVNELLDTAVSFLPGIGWGRSVYEAMRGVDLFTGKQLSDLDRTLAVIDVASLGFGSKFFKGLGIVSKACEHVGKLSGKIVSRIKDGIKASGKFKVGSSLSKSASNVAEYTKLKAYLKFQEAGVLTGEGKLTELALGNSNLLIKGGEFRNTDVIRELTRDGSKIDDWAKWTTRETIDLNSGRKAQIHFYRHSSGLVNYNIDYKITGAVGL